MNVVISKACYTDNFQRQMIEFHVTDLNTIHQWMKLQEKFHMFVRDSLRRDYPSLDPDTIILSPLFKSLPVRNSSHLTATDLSKEALKVGIMLRLQVLQSLQIVSLCNDPDDSDENSCEKTSSVKRSSLKTSFRKTSFTKTYSMKPTDLKSGSHVCICVQFPCAVFPSSSKHNDNDMLRVNIPVKLLSILLYT